ncbi:MAG: hypothetical protein NZM43_06225 [Saprospiraceae bacterium]|nr:hypothetical protein [Saprospiraceae bacterium]MDW8483907.1 hypothetical protein [Saprospiraceae bacterium]
MKKDNCIEIIHLIDTNVLKAVQSAWCDGSYDRPVWYQLIYRPRGAFILCCGAGLLAERVQHLRFTYDFIRRIGSQTDSLGRALFTESFLNYLQRLRLCADVWTASEGALLLPDEPVAVVYGPKAHVLLLGRVMEDLLWRSTHWATCAAYRRWQSGDLTEEDSPTPEEIALCLPECCRRALYVGAAKPAELENWLNDTAASPDSNEGLLPAPVALADSDEEQSPLTQIRRAYRGSIPQGDIWLTQVLEITASVGKTTATILDICTHRRRTLRFSRFQNLYQPVLVKGQPTLAETKLPYLRQRTLLQLRLFTPRKLANYPHGWWTETLV